MFVFELLIRCPHCDSITRLIVEDADPLIFSCGGCDKSIVIQGDNVFTVNSGFVKKLLKKHKTNPCGQILLTDISDTAKSMLTEGKIKELRSILKENCDVSEFIKKM